ncbi:MAG TPA: pitrilysin family protein [Rhizomicrobium sp.]|jgi:predicted Zn-dependent peptidase|nr:pitrilysin family protein [Rhizomicrobium sp.]
MNVEITRLPNGLTVVTDPMPQLESASLGVWVDCGARHEAKPLMGVSHMLEHMAFKGTERRTARGIAEEIEAVGGALNAYTSREQTAFHARVLKSDVPLAVDILADILTHPVFDHGELERERQVVLQELGQARDTPDDIIFDHLQSAVYPAQPMGWPILGNEETVGSFTRSHLESYMHANYRSRGMALIASGAVEHARMVDIAARCFGDLRVGEGPKGEPANFAGSDIRVEEDLEQVHVTWAFPGIPSGDDALFAAQVYVTALGGGMSSRLFQEIREKRGLCYSIYAFANSFIDGGMIGIYAGTGAAEAAEISALVAGEMHELACSANHEEIARAKAQLRSGLLMGLERPSARAELIASHLLAYGSVRPISEIREKLEAVSVQDVRNFGENLLNTARPAIAAIGPVGGLESYETFAARYAIAGSPSSRSDWSVAPAHAAE